MKTRLSLRRINSAACGNHRKPSETTRLLYKHTVLLSVSQHAICKMLRTKVIEIKPSKHVCFLVKGVQYFLQISLKSSRFFFLEKYQETCACENRIHKIQTSTGLYKSILVCLMSKKNLSDHFKKHQVLIQYFDFNKNPHHPPTPPKADNSH